MKSFFSAHVLSIAIGAAVIVSVGGAAWYIGSSHAPSFSATTASRGNVIASLDEAGTVLAENDAMLSFQGSGQIAHVYVSEGQTVSAGTVLTDLSDGSLIANLDQASASVDAAQANLDELMAGTRPQQLAIDQTAVASAQSSLQVDIGNAYTATDDAIHNQTDNLFSNPRSNSPVLLLPVTSSQDVNDIQNSREVIESMLTDWYTALNASSSDLSSLTSMSNTGLGQVQSYLDSLAIAVNGATPDSSVPSSVLAGYKANVAAARTEVDAAVSALTGAESALETAQNNLTLAQAGSTPQAIEVQQAVVAQAEAGLAAAQVAVSNSSLVAPFSGTVQDLTAQVGQVVSPGLPMLSLVNNSGLKIQTYVSEADVAKIKTGDVAQITLDAFGTGTVFPATVTTVANAVTQAESGTPSYLVTLHFSDNEPQVKDGMTGNVHIILAEDDNVVEVPSRLVINNGNNYFVLVQTPTGSTETPVTIGLVGDNGMTEITAGIPAGEMLQNF